MYKSGYVAIVGKPNSGKSTLINALVKEKISIVTWKPQTTRDVIRGIVTTENYQIVFVDTPGLHNANNELSKYMMRGFRQASKDSDIVLYVVNGAKPVNSEEIKVITQLAIDFKLIVAVNKLDEAEETLFADNFKLVAGIPNVLTFIPISAKMNKNLDVLTAQIVTVLPEGSLIFGEDDYTDKSVRFMVSEIIREKALINLNQEIPYGICVNITKFKERESGDIVDIDAEIYCEKDAHKSIIIGNKGNMIKKIASMARNDIERLIGSKAYLTTWVKVKPDWRENASFLDELGYNKKDI